MMPASTCPQKICTSAQAAWIKPKSGVSSVARRPSSSARSRRPCAAW
jgi:hypothetical protein